VYNFNLNNEDVLAKTVSFSSYPAAMTSWDEYYYTSSNLTIFATGLDCFNDSLYDT